MTGRSEIQESKRTVRCRACRTVVIGGSYVKGGLCTACADRRCPDCGERKTSWQGTRCNACAHRASRKWTDEAIFAAMQAWAAVHGGEAPSANDATSANGLPSTCTIQRRFGSWNAAISAAGLEPRPHGIHRNATKAQRPGAQNRQMVTGRGLDHSRYGTLKHEGTRHG